jgi:hypothetical protein
VLAARATATPSSKISAMPMAWAIRTVKMV